MFKNLFSSENNFNFTMITSLTTLALSYYTYSKYQKYIKNNQGDQILKQQQQQEINIHQILQSAMKTIAKNKDAYQRLQPNSNTDFMIKQSKINNSRIKSLYLNQKDQNLCQKKSFNSQNNRQKQIFDKIVQPYKYIFGTGGKKLRITMAVLIAQLFLNINKIKPSQSQLSQKFCYYQNSNEDKLKKIIQIGTLIQLLHAASLIIDDIQDQSLKRRDEPCAHLLYGAGVSINAANLMYFLPFKKLLEYGICKQHKKFHLQQNEKFLKRTPYTKSQKSKLFQIYSQQMLICHLGQGQDLLMHKLPTQVQSQQDLKQKIHPLLPTVQQYFRLTSAKTGALLRMMVKMIIVVFMEKVEQGSQQYAQFQQNSNIFEQIMTNIGISFQITDDILNIQQSSQNSTMGKGIQAQDLYQKKFTLIINEMKDNLEFMKLFLKNRKQKTKQDIDKMLKMIAETDAIEKSKKIAKQYANLALDGIQKIKCINSKKKFMKLVKFIVQRDR